MNKQIKVSVIVPVYNVGKFVGKCIESIQNQTYRDIEIILVNDGSTDDSGLICNRYSEKDNRIKVLHQSNKGVSVARNVGIQIATGEYICFVDGDDYISVDYVEYLLHLLIKQEAEIALSTEWFTSYNTKQVTRQYNKCLSGEEATKEILCYRIPIGVNNKLFRSNFIFDNNLKFIDGLPIGEGFNFNTAAFQRCRKVAVGNKKIYFYRKDNELSVTTRFNAEKWEKGLYALTQIKNDMILHTDELTDAWNYAWWRTNSDVYDLLILSKSASSHKDMYDSVCNEMKKYRQAYKKVNINKKDWWRAKIMSVCPTAIPLAMRLRRTLTGVKVVNYDINRRGGITKLLYLSFNEPLGGVA